MRCISYTCIAYHRCLLLNTGDNYWLQSYFTCIWLRLNASLIWGTWWSSWLKHCATSLKVVGLIPNKVIGVFRRLNPSGLTTRGYRWPLSKNDNLTTYMCQMSGNLGALNSWNRGCCTFCVFNLGSESKFFNSGCTNPVRKFVRTTKLFAMAPICGLSVWNLLHVTFQKSRILKRFLDSWSSG